MRRVIFVLLLLLAACGEESEPDYGDPIPNVRAGLTALYRGDMGGVDTYFCDQIILSVSTIANTAGLGNGRIDLDNTQFEVITQQAPQAWTVAMRGEWTIWLYGRAEAHNSTEEGEVLIGVRVEDDIWKICAFGERGEET